MHTRAGDRRTFRRLDVVGELGVALTLTEQAILRNIGPSGALIDTTIRTLQLSQEVTVRLDPSMPQVRAVVRHVSPLVDATLPAGNWRRVGLEFVALSWSDTGALHRFIGRFTRAAGIFQI